MTEVVRGALVDVYDTILKSVFTERVLALAEPLGINVEDWLAEFTKTRDDRDRGRLSTAAAFDRALRALRDRAGRRPGRGPDAARRGVQLRAYPAVRRHGPVPVLAARPGHAYRPGEQLRGHHARRCSSTSGVIPLVDAVVLSCEVGSMKPYPEIYVTALEDLGVAAADAVFIDDQPTFCLGAESVGVRPIQIARDGQAVRLTAPGWDFPVVRSLVEVPPLLG